MTVLRNRALLVSASALVLMGCTAIAVPGPAVAAETAVAAAPLTVAPGALQKALSDYSKATGVEILVDPALTEGKTSPGVSGALAPREALTRLLAGSNLDFDWQDRSATLHAAKPKPPTPPKSGTPKREASDTHADSTAGLGMDDIVVTGHRGVGEQRKSEVSYAVSTLNDEDIAYRGIATVADTLQIIPGVWADQSAGPGANVVKIRGIPLDGMQALALLEDGLPFHHDTNIGYANPDQFIRPDAALQGVEFVRGGPATLYAPNAIAGTLNYVTRKGTDKPEGELDFTTSDVGAAKVGGYWSGPVGEKLDVAVGGFYTFEDPTVRQVDSPDHGGQLHVTLSPKLGNDDELHIGFRYLNDVTLNISNYVLTRSSNGTLSCLQGFDCLHSSWFNSQVNNIVFRIPGKTSLPFKNNDQNEMAAGTVLWKHQFDDDTVLDVKARLDNSDTHRYSLSVPSSYYTSATLPSSYLSLTKAQIPGTTKLGLVDDETGEAISSNDVIMRNTAYAAFIKWNEAIADISLSKKLLDHDLTLGAYATDYTVDYTRYGTNILQDASQGGRLVDIVGLNAAGTTLGKATTDGVVTYGSAYLHSHVTVDNYAQYFSDNWQITPELRAEAGIRGEEERMHGGVEGTQTLNLGDSSTIADNAVVLGNGVYANAPDNWFLGYNASTGLNYQFTPEFGTFLRGTVAEIMPSATDYTSYSTAAAYQVSQDRRPRMKQVEWGWKYSSPKFDLFSTLFYNRFSDIQISGYDFTTLALQTYEAGTRTVGLETEGVWRPFSFLDVAADATIQDPRWKGVGLVQNALGQYEDINGRIPQRIPQLMGDIRPTLKLRDGSLRVTPELQFIGRHFITDDDYFAIPPAFLFSINASYMVNDNLVLEARGTNLTDAVVAQQGSVIGGYFGGTGSNIVIARTVAGRSATFDVRILF